MAKHRTIAVAAALLFGAVLSLRLCTPAPSAADRALAIPPLPPRDVERSPVRRVSTDKPAVGPTHDRLRPFLEKLGRARLLRDRRTLDLLRREIPPAFESDFEGLYPWLSGDLFLAAGVAELARIFGRHEAVPHLASVLGRAGHPFLKDIVIDSLGALGGDAATAALLGALRDDPDDSIRLRSAAALGGLPGPESLRALIDALRDSSPRVRTAAAAALARMNGSGAVDVLLAALRDERDPATQADLAVSAYAAGGEPSYDAILRAIEDRPAMAEVLRARVRIRDDARYRRVYDRAFFEPGGPAVPRDPLTPRIGITLEAGSTVSPREVGTLLFGSAPLDRYRDWFYVRRADDFPATAAYDASGNPMEAVPYGELEGTVFLHFKDPASFAKGVLGYTTGCHAYVQGASLLHEFGHAFARLGDEYADGSRAPSANLFSRAPVPWMPLVSAGFLGAPLRRDADFFVPSENCYLSNSLSQSRFCPVCQLEIHARVAELAGAPLPW